MTHAEDQCTWPVDTSCLPEVTPDNAHQIREAIDTATHVLWALTGRRFGVCPQVIHLPDAAPHCDPRRGPRARSAVLRGQVHAVTSVVDASGNPVSGFVVNGHRIENLPSSALTIEYLSGDPIPAGAAMMVGTLAKERYLQCIGDDRRCRLPSNTTGVSRQGVSIQLATPEDFMRAGRTGLPEVDTWIVALNPRGDDSLSEVLT